MTGDSEAAYPKIRSAANSNPAMASWASSILFTAELISPRSSVAIAFISPRNSVVEPVRSVFVTDASPLDRMASMIAFRAGSSAFFTASPTPGNALRVLMKVDKFLFRFSWDSFGRS